MPIVIGHQTLHHGRLLGGPQDHQSHKRSQNPTSPKQYVCGVYKKTLNPSILLVFNSQRIKEELDAWEELAGFIFGNKDPAGVVDMWDISQEGDFDLSSVLKSGSTLFED
jgi:hypothetical protein